jgi:hypothetical protein
MVGGVDASCAVAGASSPGATALFDLLGRNNIPVFGCIGGGRTF